jgi:hypothetical protein
MYSMYVLRLAMSYTVYSIYFATEDGRVSGGVPIRSKEVCVGIVLFFFSEYHSLCCDGMNVKRKVH